MTREMSLQVNDAPVPLDYFVQAFIDHTTSGMLEALEGTGPVKELDLTIDGSAVKINLNGKPVPTNAFASKIIRSTLVGMVSPLKGVSEVKKLKLHVCR